MTQKRTVPQAVFDSPEAQRIARQAAKDVEQGALDAWRRGDPVPEGDPNHPKYNGGVAPRRLFGRPAQQHLDLQQRSR